MCAVNWKIMVFDVMEVSMCCLLEDHGIRCDGG